MILHSIGLKIRGQTSFPRKIKVINQTGVIAPSILSKINKTRNKIAHDYYLPTTDEVQNAIDVAELFYYSTNRLSKLFVNSMTVIQNDEELFSITYNVNEIFIEIELPNLKKTDDELDIVTWITTPEGPEKELLRKKRNEYYKNKYETEFVTYSIKMEEKPDLFFKWLAFMIKIQS